VLLGVVLTASVLLLVPGQATTVVGAEVLAMGLAAWGCVVAIQLLRLRIWGTMRPDLRGAFVLRVALGQVATLPLVIAGVAVLAGAGRALLAGAEHGIPDPRGFVCRVGVARRDQPVATDRGFRHPYPPECVEGKFCELRPLGD
jgi:hypothetical protein